MGPVLWKCGDQGYDKCLARLVVIKVIVRAKDQWDMVDR